ncbi:hypothetical protein D3P08_00460 [Paenibacillus nanensis]|uniref:Uncharacterized protein n=1 Tax=Paenibacillus nanensis TaxID=393251 RepID=A0A3A1VRG6_9BACL|nr:hypothetical protein D3P08_00460 [Paenibacillus nanensis]
MNKNIDLYTKLFVDCNEGKDWVINTVSKIVYGTTNGSCVSTEQADIYIFNNEDYNEVKSNQGNDKFLFTSITLRSNPQRVWGIVSMLNRFLICCRGYGTLNVRVILRICFYE